MRPQSLSLLVLALGVLCLAESLCAESAPDLVPRVVSQSVEYTAHGSEYGKVTWRAEVQNPTGKEITVSLVLSLLDAEGQVVRSASINGVSIPAQSVATFTQTDPILQSDWGRVVSHVVFVVP